MCEAPTSHREYEETVRHGTSLFCLLFALDPERYGSIKVEEARLNKSENLFPEVFAPSGKCVKLIDVLANAKK